MLTNIRLFCLGTFGGVLVADDVAAPCGLWTHPICSVAYFRQREHHLFLLPTRSWPPSGAPCGLTNHHLHPSSSHFRQQERRLTVFSLPIDQSSSFVQLQMFDAIVRLRRLLYQSSSTVILRKKTLSTHTETTKSKMCIDHEHTTTWQNICTTLQCHIRNKH